MNWWQILLVVLAANWLIPGVLCWGYVLWLWKISHDIKFMGWKKVSFIPIAAWKLISKKSWYAKLWNAWKGTGLFMNIIYEDDPGTRDDAFVLKTIIHETRHSWQWVVLGGSFVIVYFGDCGFIYLFQQNKHPYLDNILERDARRAAKERVDIPREQWIDGPNDRWPWW